MVEKNSWRNWLGALDFGAELIGKEMGIKQALLYDSILFDRNWLTLNAHVQWMIKADSIKF